MNPPVDQPQAEPRPLPHKSGRGEASGEPQWAGEQLNRPHEVTDKAARVEAMFDAIAPSYDLNNRLHSLGRDQAWRRAAVRLAQLREGDIVLDVACGTGDLSMAFAAASPRPLQVMGMDFTSRMLAVARAKSKDFQKRHPDAAGLSYHWADAMDLPVTDQSVDVVSIAFGIRNVADPAKAMAEFVRVLKPGGRLVVLEFSLPCNRVLLGLYNFYFHQIMPRTAALIARDRSGAYKYLPKSVNTFIGRERMLEMMSEAGLVQTAHKAMTLGIAVAYCGVKPEA